MRKLVIWLATILLLAASPAGADLTGYEGLLNWSDLPLDETLVTAGLASSYDRTGGNADYNYYLSPDGPQTANVSTVLLDVTGPGILTRFWMPHYTANIGYTIKMIIDGQERIITNSNTFLDGNYGYAAAPLVQTSLGGQVSYEPITFQSSLRIESVNIADQNNYYQVNYKTLPAGTTVTPYTGSLSTAQLAARASVVSMLNNVGANPAGALIGSSLVATPGQAVPAGGSLVLASPAGSGTIDRLNVQMPVGVTDDQLAGLRLRVKYDGQADYAIDVPVAQFFGAGFGRVPYKSLPMGTDSPDGYYCYWPMPYRTGATVELYNPTASSISIGSAKVQYQAAEVSPKAGELHAVFSEETIAGGSHTLLDVPAGRGTYVGNLTYEQAPGDVRWILEGDDIVTVNPGKANQSVLHGTGTEDAYNGGYYYNHVAETAGDGDTIDPSSGAGPYSGLLHIDFYNMPGSQQTRTDQYRWLVDDAVPFTDGINVKMENYFGGAALFGSTAFYYLTPPLDLQFLPGDTNKDGFVKFADYLVLEQNFGKTGKGWADGDFTGDGAVKFADYLLLEQNFGKSLPEPASLSLLALGALAMLKRRK